MSLFEDVKELVSHGISNINCTDDVDRILLVGRNKTIKIDEGDDLNDIEEEALYLKYHWLQRQLQLALNMANNEEYFRLCWCSKPNETKKQISKEEIIDLIIEYIKCKEVLTNRENKSQNFIIEKCDFCETEIKPNEDQCSACHELVKNIISRTKRKSKEVNDTRNTKKPKIEDGSVINDLDIRSVKIEVEKDECGLFDQNVNEVIKTDPSQCCDNSNSDINSNYKLLSENIDKWLCKKCTFLNSYAFINCKVCENKRTGFGLWICEMCDFMNEAINYKCATCDQNNSQLKSKDINRQDINNNKNNKQGKPVHQRQNSSNKKNQNTQIKAKIDNKPLEDDYKNTMDFTILPKWNCWNKHCNNSNYIDCEFCAKCQLQRHPPLDGTDLVKKQYQGKTIEVWICWNKDCKQSNNDNNKFCANCKLQRRCPENSTNLVKKSEQGKIINIWICQKCRKHNNESSSNCQGRNCRTLRLTHISDPERSEKNINEMNDKLLEHERHNVPLIISSINCSVNREKGNKVENTDQWKCWYCGEMNQLKDDYCENCHLYRHGSKERGNLVAMKFGNIDKKIWFCYKCHKHNELSDSNCTKENCSRPRFNPKKKRI